MEKMFQPAFSAGNTMDTSQQCYVKRKMLQILSVKPNTPLDTNQDDKSNALYQSRLFSFWHITCAGSRRILYRTSEIVDPVSGESFGKE